MIESNALLADKCMSILCDHVGIVNAERFIVYLRTEGFDYTKWQREYYDAKSPDEIRDGVRKSSEEYTFLGKRATII